MSDDPTQKLPSDNLLGEILERLRRIEAEQNKTNAELAELKTIADSRLKETRPIWEGVLSWLEAIEIDLDKTVSVTHEVRSDLRELRRQLREHLPALK